MSIELPKDVDGREIPLDTSEMFIADGTMVHVVRFEYMHYTCDARGSWYVHINRTPGEHMTLQPCDVHLTKPDSIKQLAEDLNRMVNCKSGYDYSSPSCAYTGNSGSTYDGCKLKDSSDICSVAVIKDIAARVNRLCGDSE